MDKKELQFFKTSLEERMKVIIDQLHINSKEIQALYDSVPSDSVDISTIEIGAGVDFAISSNLKQELADIKISLEKIKNNTFGICEACDEEIGFERLKIKPHAKYCITCRQIVEKENQ